MNPVAKPVLAFVAVAVLGCAGIALAQDSAQQQMQQAQERERLEYERQMQEAQTEQEGQRIRNEYERKEQVRTQGTAKAQHGGASSGKPMGKSGAGSPGSGGRRR